MKNFATLIAVLSISFVSMAGDWPYNRLDRLYDSDEWKCLKVSQRYIKYLPEKSAPYYFASVVYKEKSKTHQQIKTRYMMMSKSISYAMKFDQLDDLEMKSKVNWGAYLEELKFDMDELVDDLAMAELSDLGSRLDAKHEKLIENQLLIVIVPDNSNAPDSVITIAANDDNEAVTVPEASDKHQYFGLASGNEVAPSYNQIQEQELLRMINEEREALFMSPLKLDNNLTRAARYHAYDMATQDYFMHGSHDRIDGELEHVATASERISQFKSGKSFSENLAAGTTSASATYTDWIGADEESDVLFDESAKTVGIGIYYDPSSTHGYYWVLVTSSKR